jgi:outer membrane immunogenic protein
MKKILLSSVALFGLTAGALAADLPRRVVAPAPYIPVPVFTWTGFYVGVNAGYGFSDRNHDDVCGSGSFGFGFGDCFGGSGLSVATVNGLAPVVPLTGNTFGFGTGFDNRNNRDGFVGGGQIGYNYQFTPGSGWVIGIEADIQGTDFGRRRNDDDFLAFGGFGGLGGGTGIFTAANVFPAVAGSGIATPTGFGNGALGNVALFNTGFGNGFGNNGFDRNRIDWFATVRGRLGYAIDRLLIFATGGVAFTDRDRRDDFGGFGTFGTGIPNGASLVGTGFYNNVAAPGASFAGSLIAPTTTGFGFFGDDRNNDNVGYAVGGGIEYAFTNNLTVKIEGLYVNFDRHRHNDNGFFGGGNVVGVSNTGAPVLDSQLVGLGDNRRNGNDFGVVRAGLNYKFTSF